MGIALVGVRPSEVNELGHFYAGDVKYPYSAIRGRPMDIPKFSTNLSNLCDAERGPALVKSGVRKSFQYRFANPLLSGGRFSPRGPLGTGALL